jgi:pimeloyl-ACP methyl ester carboxylesterase
MKEFRVKSADATLRYHDLPGEDVPIIFIHGIGCAPSFDYPQVASMGGLEKHRRILVDLIGCGFSDKPDSFDYTIENHASYLHELIDSLDLQDFVIVGHSMGGAVSITLASRVEKQLRCLILSEANLDAGGGFFSQKIAVYDELDYVNFGHDDLIKESRISSNENWAASLSVNSAIATYRTSCSLIEGSLPSWREMYYALNVPKAYIFGEYSLPDPDFDELTKQHIDVLTVSAAGHSMAWDNPEGMATAIKGAIPRTKDINA